MLHARLGESSSPSRRQSPQSESAIGRTSVNPYNRWYNTLIFLAFQYHVAFELRARLCGRMAGIARAELNPLPVWVAGDLKLEIPLNSMAHNWTGP
jgi:hypothetical protein